MASKQELESFMDTLWDLMETYKINNIEAVGLLETMKIQIITEMQTEDEIE